MFYIKIDDNNNPVGHPETGDHIKYLYNISIIDDQFLANNGYAVFELTVPPAGARSTDSGTYYMDIDGVVRNRLTVREFTQEELLDNLIRIPRSNLMFISDWTQGADSPLTAEEKAAWATYRQALRDLTKNYPNVKLASEITWPTPPFVIVPSIK
jgi:hypothetical protein